MTGRSSRLWGQRSPGYLAGEAALILAWSYLLLVAGGITALANYRIQAANTLLCALVFGCWLLWRGARGQTVAYAGFEVGVVLFLGALVLAALYSPDMRRSLAGLTPYLFLALSFYFWWDLLRAGALAELIEKTWLIVGSILIALGLVDIVNSLREWQAVALGGTLPFAPPYLYRLYTWLGDANLGAAAANLLIPLAIVRGLRAGRVARVGWWLYALLALVFVFFTSSRGGWLGTAAGLATLGVLLARDARQGRQRWLDHARAAWVWLRARSLLLAAAALLAVALAAAGALLFSRQATGPTHGAGLSARQMFWSAAWRAFLAEPLTGAGPGLFPSVYARYAGVPPDRTYQHAHSFPFTLLAEAGLNGVLGLVVLLTAMAVAFRRARQPLLAGPPPGRLAHPPPLSNVAGPLSALAGLAVHSLFDYHLLFPSVGVPAMWCLALAFHGAATVPPPLPARRRPQGVSPWLLLALGLPVAGLSVYALRAQAVFERGLALAAEDDWAAAATLFDEAARRDPAFALYPLQAGFAYGVLAADGDRDALSAALSRYEEGISREPDYSLNHANLGALYLQAGRTADARAALRRALTLSGAWLHWLNYAAAAEAEGQTETAQEAYLEALRIRPGLAGSRFWEASAVRRRARERFLAEASSGSPADLVASGMLLLEKGDGAGAQAAFEEAWRSEPYRPGVYHGLALAALSRGEEDLARAYLHAALALQTTAVEEKVLPLLAWAELSAQTGKTAEARGQYEAAYRAVVDATAYGWGLRGFNTYAWFTFGRDSLPSDLLPQLLRADVSPDLAARFLPLGALRESAGERDGAAALYRRLLELDPELSAARTRLEALGSP